MENMRRSRVLQDSGFLMEQNRQQLHRCRDLSRFLL